MLVCLEGGRERERENEKERERTRAREREREANSNQKSSRVCSEWKYRSLNVR